MSRTNIKYIGIILIAAALLFVIAVNPFCAYAAPVEYIINSGSIRIEQDPYNAGNLLITQKKTSQSVGRNTEIIIKGGETTRNSIFICGNVSANITLDNVIIENSYFLESPFCMDLGEDVVLTLIGNNRLAGSDYMAGLQVGKFASLTIRGDGYLDASGGKYAAGIGGGWRADTVGTDTGDITVTNNVNIWAYGGEGAAGVGGGRDGGARSVTISKDVSVHAAGGLYGAGIGSGKNGTVSRTILITDNAKVEAQGAVNGAGIGTGESGSVSEIAVSGSASVRVHGGAGGAGIGCGYNGSVKHIGISGAASVRAGGGENASGIGSAKYTSGSADNITIGDKSVVCSIGGSYGAGIGGRFDILKISGFANVKAYGGSFCPAIGSAFSVKEGSIEITGSSVVRALGGKNGAGIGSGSNGNITSILINSSASCVAVGGKGGAGIGTGADCGSFSTVTITDNSNVVAQGGNLGAGIGLGSKNSVDSFVVSGSLTISGSAQVRAAGGKYGAGIGGGKNAAGISVNVSDSAVVKSVSNKQIIVTVTEAQVENTDDQNGSGNEVDTGNQTGNENQTAEIGTEPDQPVTTQKSYVHGDYAFGEFKIEPDIEKQIPDEALVEPISFNPQYSDILFSDSDISNKAELEKNPAKDVGAGAGCLIQGSCIIRGDAKLNDMIGQVTVTLSYGIAGLEDQVTSLEKGKNITLPVPVKSGYEFLGWFDKPSGEGDTAVNGSVKINADKVYYARWNIIGVELYNTEIPYGIEGESFEYSGFSVAKGAEPYEYSVTAGKLPNGFDFDHVTGKISGVALLNGLYPFTVTVTDTNKSTASVQCNIKIFGKNTYTFTLTTADEPGADTASEVLMQFEYTDRFTGEKKLSDKINITNELSKLYNSPLARGETQNFNIILPPEIGEPSRINFSNETEDGWKCSEVTVSFSGNQMIESFNKSFNINSWYGKRDDGKSALDIIFLIILIIICISAVLFGLYIAIIRYDRSKKKQNKSNKKLPKHTKHS
ncbi:MAG: putative Ig domain-containing protein [Oscillospiraceae bacterium]|nr:putative Ig domain-containing protein [Oscillospiraceae bacterium]